MKRHVVFATAAVVLAATMLIHGHYCTTARASDLAVTVDDFLVNDDETGGCTQWRGEVAMNTSGDAVVVWADFRYAVSLTYARRFGSDLKPVGPSFRVSDNIHLTAQHPSVAINGSGSFVAVWITGPSDGSKTLMQLYDSDGRAVGGNIEASDPLNSFYRVQPSVSMHDDGSFLVCWVEEVKDHTQEVVARLFDHEGQPVTPVAQLSGPSSEHSVRDPRVASNGTGAFIVTWTALSSEQVYVCAINSTGGIIYGPQVVNRVYPDRRARSSSVAVAESGRYVVTWLVNDLSKADYYAFMKLFDGDGNPLTEDMLVCHDSLRSTLYPVDIAMEESGGFTLVWVDQRLGTDDIFAREFDPEGNPIGFEHAVAGADGPGYERNGSIGSSGNGKRIIVWEDRRNTHTDIYGQAYVGDAPQQGNGIRINDDVATSYQDEPDIACNSDGRFSVVWTDRRDYSQACYLQVFDPSGNPVGENIEVVDTSLWNGDYPHVALDATSRSMVVWNSYTNRNIRGQYFDADGVPTGPDFLISDTSPMNNGCALDMNESGESIVAWCTEDSPDLPEHGLFVRRYDPDGNPLGPSQMVNDYLDGEERRPSVAINDNAEFIVTWLCSRGDSSGAWGQLFDSDGSPVGPNIFLESNSGYPTGSDPSVCIDNSGAFCAAWAARDYDSGSLVYSVRARRFDPSGTPLGPEMIIDDSPELYNYVAPEIACDDDGNFIIVWERDEGDNRNIYAQIYDSGGNPSGDAYIVTNVSGVPFRQANPTAAVNGASVFFAWDDTRSARGIDIYAKVSDWEVVPTVCGDPDRSGTIDIDDVVTLIRHIFGGIEQPVLLRSGDADGSGLVDIDDVVYLVDYIFMGGSAPCQTGD